MNKSAVTMTLSIVKDYQLLQILLYFILFLLFHFFLKSDAFTCVVSFASVFAFALSFVLDYSYLQFIIF